MNAVLRSVVCLGVLTIASVAQAQQWAESMFDRMNVDMGSVARGADVRTKITVTNKFKEPMEITSVSTSCRCIKASANKNYLKSLETAEIEVVLDTVGYHGHRNVAVHVNLGGQFPAFVKIPYHAFIREDVVLTPGSINFGSVGRSSSVEQRIGVAYAGRDNWTIRSIQNPSKSLDISAKETYRGNGRVNYDLIVKVKPNAPLGDLRTQLVLVTDDTATPRIPVMVEGRVESDYTVSPDLVQFGTMQPGEKKTVNVVVRGMKPFVIKEMQSEKTADAFVVTLPPDQRKVHVLPLTFTAPSEAGAINEEFTLKINGLDQPIHFKVAGKVITTTGAARLINK